VKTIVAAWIEQILEFPSKLEYMIFISDLEQKNQKFKETKYEQLKSGVVRIRIRKQYNNNAFPDDEQKGGE
jgi:hypothetical protein